MDLARNETISKIGKVDIKEVHSLNCDLGQSGNINKLIIINPEMQNVVPTMLYFWWKMVNHDATGKSDSQACSKESTYNRKYSNRYSKAR